MKCDSPKSGYRREKALQTFHLQNYEKNDAVHDEAIHLKPVRKKIEVCGIWLADDEF